MIDKDTAVTAELRNYFGPDVVMFHFVPVLWRFHRLHHADLDVDVTTGTRFHPVEVFLSFGIKFAVIVSIGASPLSVLIFEILLNATSLFNHSNVRLPARIAWR